MEPVRLVSSVAVVDLVAGPGWAGEPQVIYDGFELDPGDEPTIEPPCINCGTPIQVDLAEVLSSRFPNEAWGLRMAEAFGLEVKRWNEFAVVIDTRGLDAYACEVKCGRCGSRHVVCVGYGEWQPARYVATYCGLALAAR